VIVAGALVVFLGFCFVGVTLISIALHWADARLLRRLRAAARPTCAELAGPGPLPRAVLVTGWTAAGPAGALRSPAYETVCAWYETEVSTGGGDDQQVTHVYRSEPQDAIRIADGTGSVLVDVRLVRQVGTVERLRRVRTETTPVFRDEAARSGSGIGRLQAAGLLPDSTRPRRAKRDLDLREDTIATELEISVLARPRRTPHGAVILGRKGQATTGAPQEWIAQVEAERVTSRWIILIFPLIGAALTAAGLGLIWVGAS
jgi:hypothetical protein